MDFSLIFPLFYLAGGVLIFFMGFVILRENPGNPVNRATALMLFSGALGSILGALLQLLDSPSDLGGASYASYVKTFSYLWEFFFPSLLYFALVFPAVHPIVQRRHVFEILIYIPHFFHLLLVLMLYRLEVLADPLRVFVGQMQPGAFGDFFEALVDFVGILMLLLNKMHQQLFSLVNLAYAGVAIGLLYAGRRRIASSQVRAQMAIVLLGLTLCVGTYVAAMLLAVFYPYRDWSQVQVVLISLALLVASASIAYAIVRHKFLDMQNLARRSLMLGGSALVLAFVYLVIIKQLAQASAGVFGSNTDVVEAGFLVLSIILFQPALNSLDEFVESVIRKADRSDRKGLIGDLSREIASEVDLRGIREKVSQRLRTGLSVERARLFTLETRREQKFLDGGDHIESIMDEDGFELLLQHFEDEPQPILRQDLERSLHLNVGGHHGAMHRWARDYQLFVPLVHQSSVRGVLSLGPKLTGGRFHNEDMALLTVLAQQVTTSIENVRLLSENVQKRILEEEINMASEIQQALLPKEFPRNRSYNSHAVSFASKFVGGDYFDLFSLDTRYIHLAIADVSGKGVPAALLMSYLRAALRSTVTHMQSPAAVLTHINGLLFESTSPEKFATFFYGVLDTEEHRLTYANAGHNYPIIVRQDRTAAELREGGLILGAFPDVQYTDDCVPLDQGDTLFMYTDGITEATDAEDQDFGEERLQATLCRVSERGPREIVRGVLDEVRAFTRGVDPADDVTMLVIRRLGEFEDGAGRQDGYVA